MSEAVYEELMESGLAVTRCQTRGRGILQNVAAGGAILSVAPAQDEAKPLKYQEKSAMSEMRDASRTGSMA